MEDRVRSKTELLNDLKIDREDQTSNRGISIFVCLLIALCSLAVGYFIALYFPVLAGPQAGNSDSVAVIPANQPNETASILASVAGSNDGISTGLLVEEMQSNELVKKVQVAVLNASGYITARRMATVSAEIMGLITEVNVEEGMRVSEGEVLARLDNAIASVNLNESKAQLFVLDAQRKSAVASLEEAEINLQRVRDNAYSSEAEQTRVTSQWSQMKANLERINAATKVAELAIERNQEILEDHVIRAPFSGVVTVKAAQPGEIVAPTSAGGGFTRTGICTIVDMDSLEIEVDVNESFIGRVFAGQKVQAQLDAYPDWNIPASVIAIIPTADRAKATVRVRIGIDIKDPRILPDMGIKVGFMPA